MAQVNNLSALSLLRTLNLCFNPIQELPDYRLAMLFNLQWLRELDGLQIRVEEKVYVNSSI